MWSSLIWWRQLRHPDIARAITNLQADALEFIVGVTLVSYIVWQYVSLVNSLSENLIERAVRYWLLFAITAPALLVTRTLHQRGSPLARGWFLTTMLLAVTSAVWLLDAPPATMLYPLLALTAVILVHPLAGLGVSAAAMGLLVALYVTGPFAFLGQDRLVETGVGSLLAVAVAWALGRQLVTAVEWSTQSYAEALGNAQEARQNRAELVQALKQLDQAYYRLQRANAALELAWRAAEAAERSKMQFVTNISHELRTPLNLVVGFSELILTDPESYRAPLPSAYRGDLNAIYRSAQHLLTLTNDVIDLARVGMHRLALVREPVDLAEVISDAGGIIRPYIEAKGLWLRMVIQPAIPVLSLDRVRIRQVLLNLLTNAARYTDRGGLTVTAELQGTHVLVKVRDTGRGIAPEDLPKVFQEFFHGGEVTHPRLDLGGVGLGLPLSKRFIDLHGGAMGVESRPGGGTTFWFTLPTGAVVDGAVAERPPGQGGRPLVTGERILVLAGADMHVTELLQRHLADYRLIPVPDLGQAIAAAVEHRALAIMTDSDSPDADAAHELPVPLLRLSLPHAERLAASLGATAYLVKPITRPRLQAAIAELRRPIQTVLIVDDDPRFVRLLERLLQADAPRTPYSVSSAHTGQEALARLATLRPDLVLLDLVMPELDGCQTLAAMRARPDLADVPVIIISAQDQVQAHFPLHGPLSIVKPDGFNLEEMLGTIEALLGVLAPPRRYLTSRLDA